MPSKSWEPADKPFRNTGTGQTIVTMRPLRSLGVCGSGIDKAGYIPKWIVLHQLPTCYMDSYM